MPSHWTYDKTPKSTDTKRKKDLKQGDILSESGLRSVIDGHSNFTDVLAFVVVTQSCDLVRRNTKDCRFPCTAPSICLAPVRGLQGLIFDLLDNEARVKKVKSGIYRTENKLGAKSLLERVFNQNETNQGMFFLFADADAGVHEDAIALLRQSFHVKTDHYDKLVESRCGRLMPEFRSKLGWLTGNIYGRVGARDWEKADIERMQNRALDSNEGDGPVWVTEDEIKAMEERGLNPNNMAPKEIFAKKKELKIKSSIERAAEYVLKHVDGQIELDDDKRSALEHSIINDRTLKKLLKS